MVLLQRLPPYPNLLNPVNLVVEEYLSGGHGSTGVEGIVEEATEEGEVLRAVLGVVLGSALQRHKVQVFT